MTAARRARKIRVALADDHRLVVEGLRRYLNAQQDIHVVGMASNGEEVIEVARRRNPDVVLMDVDMPTVDGIEATRRLSAERPLVKVIVLTGRGTMFVGPARRAGARGYLLKNASAKEVVAAIRGVVDGGSVFPCDERADAGNDLSERERQVVISVALGRSNKQIADELGISVRTVETHRNRIMHKLHLKGAAALTRWAIVHGLVDADV